MIGTYHNGFAPRDAEPEFPQLWRGCVGAWCPSLGPTGATLRDWSGRANHATLTNEPGTDWVIAPDGKLGGAWALDFATDDLASVSGVPNTDAEATWCGWMYHRQIKNQWLINRDVSAGDREMLLGFVEVGGPAARFYAFTTLSGGLIEIVHSTVASINTWYFVAATVKGSTLTVWVNGGSPESVTGTGSKVNGVGAFQFGARTRSSDFNNSLCDDWAIYNRALNTSELLLRASRRGIAYEMRERRRAGSAVGRIPGGATMTGGMYVNQCGGMVA